MSSSACPCRVINSMLVIYSKRESLEWFGNQVYVVWVKLVVHVILEYTLCYVHERQI